MWHLCRRAASIQQTLAGLSLASSEFSVAATSCSDGLRARARHYCPKFNVTAAAFPSAPSSARPCRVRGTCHRRPRTTYRAHANSDCIFAYHRWFGNRYRQNVRIRNALLLRDRLSLVLNRIWGIFPQRDYRNESRWILGIRCDVVDRRQFLRTLQHREWYSKRDRTDHDSRQGQGEPRCRAPGRVNHAPKRAMKTTPIPVHAPQRKTANAPPKSTSLSRNAGPAAPTIASATTAAMKPMTAIRESLPVRAGDITGRSLE
jgi:hypothetical protein